MEEITDDDTEQILKYRYWMDHGVLYGIHKFHEYWMSVIEFELLCQSVPRVGYQFAKTSLNYIVGCLVDIVNKYEIENRGLYMPTPNTNLELPFFFKRQAIQIYITLLGLINADSDDISNINRNYAKEILFTVEDWCKNSEFYRLKSISFKQIMDTLDIFLNAKNAL
jgi:hypothetical protein